MLTSNYLSPSASFEVVISQINRTVDELCSNIDIILPESRLNAPFWRLFLPFLGQITVMFRTKYSRTTPILLKYLKNYDFHCRRSDNFDFFQIFSNLVDIFRSQCCQLITFACLHLSK